MTWQRTGRLFSERDAQVARLTAELAGVRAELAKHTTDIEEFALSVDDLVTRAVAKALLAVPVPKDGTSVTVDDVAPLIAKEVATAVASLPVAKDGAPGRDGADGSSVTVDDVAPLIAKEVTAAVSALPAPKDGAPGRDGSSVTVEDLEPLVTRTVEHAVAAIPPATDGRDGKDGVGVTAAVLDHEGCLVLTLSDGTLTKLGRVVGRDVDPELVQRQVQDLVAQMPPPKDGKDGRDGFGFEDFSCDYDQHRTLTLRFTRGDETKEFPITLPVALFPTPDEPVWRETRAYEANDLVQMQGSVWMALRQSQGERPGNGTTAWRLLVKQGGLGKPGPIGPQGPMGPAGKDGRMYK